MKKQTVMMFLKKQNTIWKTHNEQPFILEILKVALRWNHQMISSELKIRKKATAAHTAIAFYTFLESFQNTGGRGRTDTPEGT